MVSHCTRCNRRTPGSTIRSEIGPGFFCSKTCANAAHASTIDANDAPRPPLAADVLDTDSDARKEIPIFSGVLNYFPLAIAAVARLSKRGNDKHNPGQPLHWSRDKSQDHADCIARHLIDVETLVNGEPEHAMGLAWRALALLQLAEEKRLGKTPSRGSK